MDFVSHNVCIKSHTLSCSGTRFAEISSYLLHCGHMYMRNHKYDPFTGVHGWSVQSLELWNSKLKKFKK